QILAQTQSRPNSFFSLQNHKMARQAQSGYMEWPSAPRWMEPLLADDGQGQLVTVSRLANADLQRARDSNGGLRLEDLRYPVAARGKYKAAKGAFPQNEGEDRLIPGDGKTLFMASGQPSKYLPRRRKLPPNLSDNGILSFSYEGNPSCAAVPADAATAAKPQASPAPVGRALDVSSVTGRHYSRRRMIVQPDGFFGHQGQPVSQSSHQSLRRATFGDKV
uniref:Tub domain-containing protein n=1 Tax=Macrostomum lignano TaxID=282301 RepID=A0A1I8IHL4_9PLAT